MFLSTLISGVEKFKDHLIEVKSKVQATPVWIYEMGIKRTPGGVTPGCPSLVPLLKYAPGFFYKWNSLFSFWTPGFLDDALMNSLNQTRDKT